LTSFGLLLKTITSPLNINYKHLNTKEMKQYILETFAILLGILLISLTSYLFGFETTTITALGFIMGKLLINDINK